MNEQQLRLGDADREAAATELAEHYAQGRITADEHAERLDRIWAARTRGELQPVFRDLPDATRPATVRGTSRGGPPAYWSGVRRGPIPSPLFLVLAVLVVLTIVTHVPFVLIGLLAVLFVALRHRRGARWAGPAR